MEEAFHSRLKLIKIILCVITAFFTALALGVDRSTSKDGINATLEIMSGNSVLIFLIFILLAILYYKAPLFISRRKMVYAAVGAAFFSTLESIGYCFNQYNAFSDVDVSKLALALNICVAIGMFFIFYVALAYLFYVTDRQDNMPLRRLHSRVLCGNTQSFFIVAAILVLLWMPYYLTYFPGAMTRDTHVQLGQILGHLSLSDNNPIVHTQLMGLFVRLGKAIFGNVAGGVAVFTFFQMLLLALLYSYVIFFMAKRGFRPAFRILALLFYGLYPVNAIYCITLWKDVWLSAFILLYVMCLVDIYINQESFFSSRWSLVKFALILLGMFFFKGVGMVVFLVSLPFLLLAAKKHYKRILLVSLCCIAFYSFVNGPVLTVLQIQKRDAQLMLSVPLQQIARTVKEHDAELTDKEKATISSILPYDELPNLYNPRLSDPVKARLNAEVYEKDVWRFTKLWAKLFFKYPQTYLESFFANNFGYWYPEAQNWIVPKYGYIDYELNSAKTRPSQVWDEDLYNYIQPKLLGVLKKAAEVINNGVRNVPVLSMAFSIGFMNWVLLSCALACLVQKRRPALLPFTPLFGVFLVCIFSPVFLEFRYAYPVALCLPLIIAVTMAKYLTFSKSLSITTSEISCCQRNEK